MFLSKRRNLVFPQSEHARLAGHLACEWGNNSFKAPHTSLESKVSYASFCTGVALHDEGYGLVDTHAIGAMPELVTRERFVKLMNVELEDRIAEIIVKHHVLRLLVSDGYTDLADVCRSKIRELVSLCDIPIDVFQRMDSITQLCDSIAFDFCFEDRAEGHVDVTTCIMSTDSTSIYYCIGDEANINLAPWPFDTKKISGYMRAYKMPDYPNILETVVVPYHIAPK